MKAVSDWFWKWVQKTETCWLVPATHGAGYGQVCKPGQRISTLAHRASWEIHYGPIPKGLHVCHHCDVRNCVRPDHLFVGTQKDNAADAVQKGRMQKGSRNGRHKITEEIAKKILALKDSGLTGVQVARAFSLTKSSVYFIWHRQTWRHI